MKNDLIGKIIAGVCIAAIGCVTVSLVSTSSDVKVQAQLLANHGRRLEKGEAHDVKFFDDLSQIKGDIRVIRGLMEHQAENNK